MALRFFNSLKAILERRMLKIETKIKFFGNHDFLPTS